MSESKAMFHNATLLPQGCHLRLNDGLLKQLMVFGIGRVTVSYTLHVL